MSDKIKEINDEYLDKVAGGATRDKINVYIYYRKELNGEVFISLEKISVILYMDLESQLYDGCETWCTNRGYIFVKYERAKQ